MYDAFQNITNHSNIYHNKHIYTIGDSISEIIKYTIHIYYIYIYYIYQRFSEGCFARSLYIFRAGHCPVGSIADTVSIKAKNQYRRYICICICIYYKSICNRIYLS